MKIFSMLVLVLLVFLAVSSGVTKVLLMPQDVEFFGQYGFTNPLLFGFGLVQLSGGVLMVFRKTRFVGAAIVAITFLVSLVVLLLEGNIPVSVITVVATMLLGFIMKQNWKTRTAD